MVKQSGLVLIRPNCHKRRCVTVFHSSIPLCYMRHHPGLEGRRWKKSEIVSTLILKHSQGQRAENAIVATHYAHLTREEYNSMREFCPGSWAILDDSIEQQLVADCREWGLSYTNSTILINRDCIKSGRITITRSDVCTNMVHEVLNTEKRPQGIKGVDSTWTKCC